MDTVTTEPEGLCRHLWIVFPGDEDYGGLGVFFGDFFGKDQPRSIEHLNVAKGKLEVGGSRVSCGPAKRCAANSQR